MNNAEKTLVLLSPGFPENETNTVCLPAQQAFIRAIRNHFPGLKIIILSFQYPHTTVAYEWHQALVIPFNGEFKKKLSKLMVWYRIWKKLNQLNRERRIIGLFSFWCADCALIGKYFSRFHALPHYCWILGQDARKDNRFVRWIRPRAEELVTISDFLVREFLKNHRFKPVHLIPMGIDISLYPTPPAKRDIDALGVGSLIALKQYDVFVRVIAELKKRRPSIRTLICGKGPEMDRLQSLITEFNLDQNIELTGEKSHPEILQLMQRSRAFLHPSSYEGLGMVCLEALYAGAQVISFCKPMDPEIPHWNIAGSEEEMWQLLLSILQDPAIDHRPVLPYPMRDSALAVLKLFDYGQVDDS
jgi:glycosyltransferase involved in cell wall biosynthesis